MDGYFPLDKTKTSRIVHPLFPCGCLRCYSRALSLILSCRWPCVARVGCPVPNPPQYPHSSCPFSYSSNRRPRALVPVMVASLCGPSLASQPPLPPPFPFLSCPLYPSALPDPRPHFARPIPTLLIRPDQLSGMPTSLRRPQSPDSCPELPWYSFTFSLLPLPAAPPSTPPPPARLQRRQRPSHVTAAPKCTRRQRPRACHLHLATRFISTQRTSVQLKMIRSFSDCRRHCGEGDSGGTIHIRDPTRVALRTLLMRDRPTVANSAAVRNLPVSPEHSYKCDTQNSTSLILHYTKCSRYLLT